MYVQVVEQSDEIGGLKEDYEAERRIDAETFGTLQELSIQVREDSLSVCLSVYLSVCLSVCLSE
jgi:hypothetical protein